MNGKDSLLKSALRSRRSKNMGMSAMQQAMPEPGAEDPKNPQAQTDLAPLPEHSQPGTDGADDSMNPDAGGDDPVISIDKRPDKTVVSVEVPAGGGDMSQPDMDDMHEQMLGGLSDQDKSDIMSRAKPRSIGEAARKSALMSKK